ncbi:MAG: cation:proton antiporter [Peptoniphilaceae bacterium]
MLTSIAIILLGGIFASRLFKFFKLPGLIGMILVGIAFSPNAFNLLDNSILSISPEIRRIALVIILARAGLSLDIEDLKEIGRPAVLMSFLPASLEIMGTILIAPRLFNITVLDAAIIGSVIAAVSPAVIVPRMIELMEKKYGNKNKIPQLILAGSSVDDVFVIVIFTSLISLEATGKFALSNLFQIPISIFLGIILGLLVGILMDIFFRKIKLNSNSKLLIILSISFLLLEIETSLKGIIPISGLLAIMSMGITLKGKDEVLAKDLAKNFNHLWQGAEIFLFVLVGATVDLSYAISAGLMGLILVLGAMVFRMIGVRLSLIKTRLEKKEKIFCMLAYTPKATVQAAIGSIPLSMGLKSGQLVLTIAVLSILITAPFGAICVDNLYNKLLSIED